MNYEKPELLEQLAAAYVLGTLRGGARRRFARLARESSVIQREIWRWERQLLPLTDKIEPQIPPPGVWQGIEEQLGFRDRPANRSLGWLWPAVSALLALALVALVLPFPTGDPAEQVLTPAERLAFIQDTQQQPLWVVTVDDETGLLSSIAVNAPAKDADRVFELWMLPEQGPPRSFGLLPTAQNARRQQSLSPALIALLGRAKGVAVSLEPPGGSPTGAPTGPVLFTAPVIEL